MPAGAWGTQQVASSKCLRLGMRTPGGQLGPCMEESWEWGASAIACSVCGEEGAHARLGINPNQHRFWSWSKAEPVLFPAACLLSTALPDLAAPTAGLSILSPQSSKIGLEFTECLVYPLQLLQHHLPTMKPGLLSGQARTLPLSHTMPCSTYIS